MTVVIREGAVLRNALDMLDRHARRGELTPDDVVSVIDNICIDMELAFCDLPVELRVLRTEAVARRRHDYATYQEAFVADRIVMCGLWAA